MFETMRHRWMLIGWIAVLGIAAVAVNAHAPRSTRETFGLALLEVDRGMSPDDVRALLGPPDEVRTQFTPGGLPRDNLKERWCYGVVSAGGFPTLGIVDFDTKDRVWSTCGGTGTPIAPDILDEPALRRVLTAIDRVPNIENEWRERHYNPLDVIQVVNALQPLGRDGALAVLDEYLRVAPVDYLVGPSNVMLIALALFEHEADDPPLAHIMGQEHRATHPHYPIVLWHDVPLFIFPLGGSFSSGPPRDYGKDLRLFRTHGKLRPNPLVPPDDALAILADIEQSPSWVFSKGGNQLYTSEAARHVVMNQLLWLVETAYPVPVNCMRMKIARECVGPDIETQWKTHLRTFPTRGVRWDAKQQMYVQPDGTALPRWRNSYGRNIWDLTRPGATIKLTIERRTPENIIIGLSCVIKSTAFESPGGTIEVFSADDPEDVLATFGYPAGGRGSGTSMASHGVQLPEGRIVQVRVVNAEGEAMMSSPIYEP